MGHLFLRRVIREHHTPKPHKCVCKYQAVKCWYYQMVTVMHEFVRTSTPIGPKISVFIAFGQLARTLLPGQPGGFCTRNMSILNLKNTLKGLAIGSVFALGL